MKTIKAVSTIFRGKLAHLYDLKEIDSICMLVLTEVAGTTHARIKAFPELELSWKQIESLKNILDQLVIGKPIQYILGQTEFYGLTFKVNPSVLIPRPETEELVYWTISLIKETKLAGGNILDIGTGSGCIAISLKKNLPEFSVSAIDISSDALKTAGENAELNNTEVNFILGDILNPKLNIQNSKFEIIVSNPPYVTLDDKKQMHTNVTDFEPHTALFVPENDPLIFYKAITDFASKNLKPGGLLFFEINESYGEQTVELLNSKRFINIELRKDMGGRDRMIKAVR
ncbi:peptide chain release factor N(5)-glutamine methyltransferase [Mucilaginibacter ginsenosidivorans]|uniref:Release factor glutamine methyltransferase n=1 Tax=Mucilaginibacter ginsenosidivorans TaxID=398053 RepID=A0A5B8UZW6_9SPHI|nr:peptide chain release factor N(5)-glutamine methyltransferase [Mucilaginibacter ginsenosidivorans]QEC64529.1 peptide chain release factor N(5)-glutamine methyltransferase [Mucilaginibacter ginsenosidivorans]